MERNEVMLVASSCTYLHGRELDFGIAHSLETAENEPDACKERVRNMCNGA